MAENIDLKSMGFNSANYIHNLYQIMNLSFARQILLQEICLVNGTIEVYFQRTMQKIGLSSLLKKITKKLNRETLTCFKMVSILFLTILIRETDNNLDKLNLLLILITI